MLPSPSSSPIRPTFVNLTNSPRRKRVKDESSFSLPTPPEHRQVKRSRATPDTPSRRRKRVKVSSPTPVSDSEDDLGGESLVDGLRAEEEAIRARARKTTVFAMREAAFTGRPRHMSWSRPLPTRPVLQTLVSFHKSDVFKCLADDVNFLGRPYACAFSNGAKQGRSGHLAVATEHGTVDIFDTLPRKDWDPEPSRTTLRPHDNGVFDVLWSTSDTLIATCSGDHTVRVSDPQRPDAGALRTLTGAGATVKCLAWRSENESVLAAGARNGKLLVWDVRTGDESPALTLGLDKMVKGKRTGKLGPPSQSITGILFSESDSYSLVSAGSHDGILRQWDFRLPATTSSRAPISLTSTSPTDPTVRHGALRPHGLTSLVAGHGPSAGLLFALGTDARVHVYASPTLSPLPPFSVLSHPEMVTPSFYVRAALSPCGTWLATGGSGTDPSAFAFDVSGIASSAARGPFSGKASQGVQLRGQKGEVGAVAWTHDALATCADDGTVRVWRPDITAYRRCEQSPEEATWDCAWAV